MQAQFGMPFMESGGQAQGMAVSAAAGLTKRKDAKGREWAWYAPANQWQLLHHITGGDTLWDMTGTYYGARTMDGVKAIGNHPLNKPIVGATKDQAIPGDVVLIPALPNPSELGAPGGTATPNRAQQPISGPIVTGSTPFVDPPADFPIVLGGSNGAMATPAALKGAAANGAEASWWTTRRKVAVGLVGAGALGLAVWLWSRGKKRRNPSRRKRRRSRGRRRRR